MVVWELETLDLKPRWVGEVVSDYPGLRVQQARGYKAILVNGEVTVEHGECTGATPGKLLRHGRG